MSISSNSQRNDYTGTGVVSTYGYGFKIFNESHLLVLVLSSLGTLSLKTLNIDYSVTGVGNNNGGNIVLSSPLPSGDKLIILGSMSIEQQLNIGNEGAFYPEVIEEAFDKRAIIDQQQQEQLNRSVKLPVSLKNSDFDISLPAGISNPVNKGRAIIINATNDGFDLGDEDHGPAAYANLVAAAVLENTTKSYFCNTNAGAFAVTLPLASDNGGMEFFVKNVDLGGSNDLTVNTSGSDTIDSESSDVLTSGESRVYISNGTNWFIKF